MPPNATFAEGNALRAPQPADIRVEQRARDRAAAPVTVEVADGARLAEIQSEWHDLIGRADVSNVFMHPVLVALSASDPNLHGRALVAWKQVEGAPRLVGFWAFAVGRARRSIFPISMLTAPFFRMAIGRRRRSIATCSMKPCMPCSITSPAILAFRR